MPLPAVHRAASTATADPYLDALCDEPAATPMHLGSLRRLPRSRRRRRAQGLPVAQPDRHRVLRRRLPEGDRGRGPQSPWCSATRPSPSPRRPGAWTRAAAAGVPRPSSAGDRERAAPLDLADVQGDILRAYGNDYACTSYVFVARRRRRRRALVAARAAPARDDRRAVARGKPTTTLNVALTADGPGGARRLADGGRHLLGRVPRRDGRRGPSRWATAARAIRSTGIPVWARGGAHVLLTINATNAGAT